MNVLISIFDKAVDIHEYALVVVFLALTLGFRNKKPLIPCIVAVGLCMLQVLLNNTITIPYLTALVFGLADVAYAVLFFGDSPVKRVFMGVVPSVIFAFSEWIAITSLELFMPGSGDPAEIAEATIYKFGAQVVYVCINISLVILLSSIMRKKKSGYLPKKQMIFMSLMIVPTIFLISMLTNMSIYASSSGNDKTALMCTVGAGILSAVAVGIYVMFKTMSRTLRQSLDKERELQKLELEKQHYTDVCDAYEKLRIWKHDSLNRIHTLEYLVKNNGCNEIMDFIEKATGEVEELENLVSTGHPTVDAILSSEFSKAKRAGIRISPVIILPKTMPFDDMDLCSVISNLLDNAIECVQKFDGDKRYIDFEIRVQEESLVISVINPSDGMYKTDRNGRISTTKSDSESHGLGLKIVSGVVEKVKGVFEIIPYKDKFDATVILPLWEVN